MKKLISIFAAVALVGSIAAAPKRPVAPAKPAVAAPVVAAPTVSTATSAPIASGKALGLQFGLSAGFVTDMFKQGETLKKWAGAAGGGSYATGVANASSSSNLGFAGTATASGDGSSVSLNGIDIGLKVQYDIMPWLFVRSGANYVLGLKNTYTLSQTLTQTSTGGTTTNNLTFTATGNTIEVPILVGFNFVNNEHGSLYFAGGVAYVSGTYETTLSASRTITGAGAAAAGQGAALTYADVLNTTKQSGLGVMWLVGGKAKITGGVHVFGDIKFLSAAAAKAGAVTGTNYDSTVAATSGGYATSSSIYTSISGAGATSGATIQGGTATSYLNTAQTGTGGLDLSYTRWQFGVQYDL
jgi:hypothetical protein